jgi:hypothetical protein
LATQEVDQRLIDRMDEISVLLLELSTVLEAMDPDIAVAVADRVEHAVEARRQAGKSHGFLKEAHTRLTTPSSV